MGGRIGSGGGVGEPVFGSVGMTGCVLMVTPPQYMQCNTATVGRQGRKVFGGRGSYAYTQVEKN